MARAAPLHETERRRSLIQSAFREVAEKGFSEVTLEDIALRAGVSKGVTLYHFRSKDDLLSQLFAWLVDSIHRRMREAVDAAEDPVSKLAGVIALTFPSPSKNRAFFRAYVDFCGLAARRETYRKIAERFYAGCREIDEEIVREGVDRGVFASGDPAGTASTMRAVFDGLMMQWLAEADPDGTFADYRRRCERELLRYLTAGEGPRRRAPDR